MWDVVDHYFSVQELHHCITFCFKIKVVSNSHCSNKYSLTFFVFFLAKLLVCLISGGRFNVVFNMCTCDGD